MASDKHETERPPHDHAPRQEEQQHRDRPPAAPKAGAAPAPDAQAAAALKEAQAASSIGAQVILDFNSQAGLGARGGAAGTVEENSMLRDQNLVAIGLDPVSPSGPPTGEPYVPPAVAMAATPKHVSGQATKVSSLAAGIQDAPTPPPPATKAA